MTKYIALLRGINVGGKRKILMQDLKMLLAALSFENVQTYIQSGNIVFESSWTDEQLLAKKIQASIYEKYGFDVPVIIIKATVYHKLIEANPFVTAQVDTKKLYCVFLNEKPRQEAITSFKDLSFGSDNYFLADKIIYIQYASKISDSKLSNAIVEKKLAVIATARNWRTSLKLFEMSK